MTRITERQFQADLAGSSLDVQEAARDPALAEVDVAGADLNGDGEIAGYPEVRALFEAFDALDHDGSPRSISPGEAQQRALQALAARTSSRALEERLSPPSEDVLFVGLNPSGATEAAAIARRTNVISVGSTTFDESPARIDGRTHDLATPEGVRNFVRTLGLPPAQAERVAVAIEHADHAGRDDLARIAAVWAPAERGERIPSRLVLSGHASGTGVHGAGGTVSRAALGRLAAAMPHAARQIEDLAVSACWSAVERKVDEWRTVFPQLRTMFGYEGGAPSEGGAARHLAIWERATRGRTEDLPRTITAGTRRSEDVATWSVRRGWEASEPPRSIDVLRGEWRGQTGTVYRYLRGLAEVDDPQTGPLRSAYTSLMQLLGRPELPAAEHADLDADRAQLVRLLFFRDAIAPHFAEHFAREIEQGYAAIGEDAPDFGRMGRGQALDAIASFERRVAAMNRPPAAAARLRTLLTEGLGGLSPDVIPDSWI